MTRARQASLCCFVMLACALLGACAIQAVRPDGSPEPVPVDAYLRSGARTLWVAPHPDDELFAGALLARASIHYGLPLRMLVLTRGGGGECGLGRGCSPDLAAVRTGEMRRAADLYRAELQQEDLFNAPLPVESFPSPEEILARWRSQTDPVRLIASAIRRFRPDLLLTFDPHWGATGHPEHQLTARLCVEAVRLAADPKTEIEGLPAHRTGRIYFLQNRYWLLALVGRADPGPVTETWDARLPCGEQSCLDFMLRATRYHRSQHRDMARVHAHRSAFETLHLRQVDPFEPSPLDTSPPDPLSQRERGDLATPEAEGDLAAPEAETDSAAPEGEAGD
ncbi:MAG: PIG-L family deacetylase [Deltaproteobacteria bacterium]|nr:PIG-L family deacetylase [Deltaproteobacteria bacterium]